MKKYVLFLIFFISALVSCKNNKTKHYETSSGVSPQETATQDFVVLSDTSVINTMTGDEPVIERSPIQVKQFTEEDRYFSLDGRYRCDVYSGLSGIYINNSILTYEVNEEVENFTDTEQKISFINKNGVDYLQLSKKFPKELTSKYLYGESKDVETDDKILFLAGKTETLDTFLYAYTKGFDLLPFTDNATDELYYCLFDDASSCLVENDQEYPLENLYNRKLETPWIEGVPGDGIGEGFTITFNMGDVNPTLLLMNGYISFDKPYLYEQNNRIKKIKVKGLTSGKEKILDVIDTPHPQTVDISFITEMEDIRIEIADVYKGTKYDDTCLQYCSTFIETVIPYKSGKTD